MLMWGRWTGWSFELPSNTWHSEFPAVLGDCNCSSTCLFGSYHEWFLPILCLVSWLSFLPAWSQWRLDDRQPCYCIKLPRLVKCCLFAWALKCVLMQQPDFSDVISRGTESITACVFFLQGWIVKATSSWPKHSVTVDCSSPVLKAFWKPTALQLVLDFVIPLLSAWKSVVFVLFF